MAPSGLTVNLIHGYGDDEPTITLESGMPTIVLTTHDGSQCAAEGAAGKNLMKRAIDTGKTIPDPYSLPLEDLDVSNPRLYETWAHHRYFERLREEAQIHYCKDSALAPTGRLPV